MASNSLSAMETNEDASLPQSKEFTTIDLQETDEEMPSENYPKHGRRHSLIEAQSNSNDIKANESLFKPTYHTTLRELNDDPQINHQTLPIADLSPSQTEGSEENPAGNFEEGYSPRPTDTPEVSISSLTFRNMSPSMSSTIFSFAMTLAFVCVLWLVVFMIFGYRGHAIAGVFIGLFIVGLLINTCFLKLYFRLKVYLGLSAAIAAVERQVVANRRRDLQAQLAAEKAAENPPSYETVMESPPPYSFLQYYRQKKSTCSINSSASRASFYRKNHNCPFCRRDVKIFGICVSCKNNLAKN